jgi:TRAP-type C4-dicarboxylate transport system substrate-binding protein
MRRHIIITAAVAILLVAACGSNGDTDDSDIAEAADTSVPTDDTQAVEDPGEPVTLRMGSPYFDQDRAYPYTPAVYHFQDRVEELSGRNITIEVVYGVEGEQPYSFQADGEQQVVRSVADGELDMAWAGTRVFDTLGVTSFQALHAPLLVDGYELQAAILDSDMPDRMLAGLEDIGLAGLDLLAGGLRKPVGVDGHLLNPDDFAGITFEAYRSQVQADAVAALGATPTDVTAHERDSGEASREIQGHEHSLVVYTAHGSAPIAPYVAANVNLWPETTVLIANPDVLAGLSDTQAGWLREAAADAAAASAGLHDVDDDLALAACEQGARFAEASPSDLDALRAAVEPVYDGLLDDDLTADLVDEIEDLKRSVAPAALTVPDGCGGDAPRRAVEGADDPALLNGTYEIDWTLDELVDAGVPEGIADQFRMAGTFTWTFADGTLTQELNGEPSCPGTYGVTGDRVDIRREAPCPLWLWTATWELTDTELSFSDTLQNGADQPLLEIWLGQKPWTTVG